MIQHRPRKKSRAQIEDERFQASLLKDGIKYFTAYLHLGAGDKIREVHATFEEAEAAAERLTRERGRGRRAMIYAVNHLDYTILCDRELLELAKTL